MTTIGWGPWFGRGLREVWGAWLVRGEDWGGLGGPAYWITLGVERETRGEVGGRTARSGGERGAWSASGEDIGGNGEDMERREAGRVRRPKEPPGRRGRGGPGVSWGPEESVDLDFLGLLAFLAWEGVPGWEGGGEEEGREVSLALLLGDRGDRPESELFLFLLLTFLTPPASW